MAVGPPRVDTRDDGAASDIGGGVEADPPELPPREAAFLERAERAMAPLLELPMAIGLDDSTARGKHSLTYRLAEDLRHNRGVKVYVEATPPSANHWWFDYPVIIREHLWQKRLRDPEYASRAQLKNELIRYPRTDYAWAADNPADAWPPRMCRVIAEGDSLMVDDFWLNRPGRDLSGLVDCANALVQGGAPPDEQPG